MSGTDHTQDPLNAVTFDALMAPFAVSRDEHVAVAVSGGADSMALALLVAAWNKAAKTTALIVDHGLRPESAAEARQVGAWLTRAGVDHHILTWRHKPAHLSAVQARARDARYALMAEWCRAHRVKRLFVAHHQGDQAETFVMRLKRSSTLFGLAAMAPERTVHGISVCRPLLSVSKARLETTLRAWGQDWVVDPSNTNPAFERVRTRALLAHLDREGVTAERLAGAARAAGLITKTLDAAVSAFIEGDVTSRTGGGFSVAAGAFCALPQVLRERVLSHLLRKASGQVYGASPDKLARFVRWLVAPTNGTDSARTLGGCVVRVRSESFSIVPEAPRKCLQGVKKARFISAPPLPPAVKGLTSQASGNELSHTKC